MLLVAFRMSTNTVIVRFGSTFPHQSIDLNRMVCDPCIPIVNGAFGCQAPPSIE